MRQFELIAPCHFGLEAVLKREILDLGYEISKVEDGKVSFWGDEEAVAYANMFLRTAERILLKVGEFKACTYDELFEGTKALPWEEYIPENGKFWVKKASSIKSKLFSPSDIQSIMKKAMVERMKQKYHRERFEEDGVSYPVRVSLMKDIVTVGIDTTGVSLHKRGYRKLQSKAPISETLGSSTDHADAVEERTDSGGSFLRKRNVPDRSCHDGMQYRSGYEPFVPCRGLDKPDSAQTLV